MTEATFVVIVVLAVLALVFLVKWRATADELESEKAIAADEADDLDKWRGIARQRRNALRRIAEEASEALTGEEEDEE